MANLISGALENPLLLGPPNFDYQYFQALAGRAFNPLANSFDATNASLLADAALLAYAQPAFATPWFQKLSSRPIVFFTGDSTQAYGIIGNGFVLVAFRGTEIRNIRNFIADSRIDSDFAFANWKDDQQVHGGFLAAFGEVWNQCKSGVCVSKFLQDAQAGAAKPIPVWFTGHSLGAALATLATARYSADHAGASVGLYTYGSPRVGNPKFAQAFPNSSAFRVVHNHDPVTRLPPASLGVRHVGVPWMIDASGNVSADPGLLDGADPTPLEEGMDWLGGAGGMIQLLDHVPVFYAKLLRQYAIAGGA